MLDGIEASSGETRRPATILVVDDEADILDLLAETLGADGHQVDTAANGLVALEQLDRRSYDLILSDIQMPGLDGMGLYRALEDRHPAMVRRFILITGSSLTAEARRFVETTAVRILHKPFDVQEIRRVGNAFSGAHRNVR